MSAVKEREEKDQYRPYTPASDAILRKPYKEIEIFALLERLLGIRFVREDAVVLKISSKKVAVLTPEELHEVPGEWRKRFKEVTRLARVNEMNCLVEQLGPEYRHIANGLTELIEYFQFERILQLLSETDDASETD